MSSYKEEFVAVIKENQKIANDKKDNSVLGTMPHSSFAIPLEWISSIFLSPRFIGFDIASVQAMVQPGSTLFSFDKGESASAVTRRLKPVYDASFVESSKYNETMKQEYQSVLQEEIILEFNRYILGHLNNMSTPIHGKLDDAIEKAKDSSSRPINWMVTSPDVLSSQSIDVENYYYGVYCTTLKERYKGLKVIVDPLFPTKQVLLGHKGDGLYDSNYVFGFYAFGSWGSGYVENTDSYQIVYRSAAKAFDQSSNFVVKLS